MSRYVDNDFVLGGRKPPLWEKPGYLTNSQLTTTTRNLNTKSSITKYDPPLDGKHLRGSFNRSNSDLSLSLQDLDRSNSSLKKSVSFNSRRKTRHYSDDEDSVYDDDETDEELMKLIDHDDSQVIEPAVSGRAKTPEESQWYTQPKHLVTSEYNPAKFDAGLAPRATSPVTRLVGAQGAKLADTNVMLEIADRRTPSCIERYPMSTDDPLAKEFFPTTFSARYIMDTIKTPKRTITPKPDHLKKPPPPKWRVDGKLGHRSRSRSRSRSRKGGLRARSISPVRRSESPTRGMYLMATEAPHIAASTVSTHSPYQLELARLRMERLRLEEQQLLEVKRQEELERIRGPKPKWYELKTPDFHYEAHKNNELVNNQTNWQELLDYRNELLDASSDFQRSGTVLYA